MASMTPISPLPLVVLISGSGSNLQAIIDRSRQDLPVEIRAVISNEPAAYGLERARQAGIETRVLSHKGYPSRSAYDAALMDLIDAFSPGLIVLAGFMRILTPELVQHYAGRIFNIHPALLPKYKGLHTHQRVLSAGEKEHGASVHFVTEELDGGPVILQAKVPVFAGDTPDELAARVLRQEHRIYPLAIRLFAEGRLGLRAGRLVLDGSPLAHPLLMDGHEV